jgi:two-component system, LytTR family, sensor kinase
MPSEPRPTALLSHPASRPWSRRTELAAIGCFWTALGVLTVIRLALSPRGPSGIFNPGSLIILIEYALWALVTPLVLTLAHRLPLERGALARRLAIHLLVAFSVAAAFEVLRIVALRPMLFSPDQMPQRGPWRRSPGEALLQLQFLDELVVYLAVLAAGFARDYFLRFRERERETVLLAAQLSEARLSALRMQLNPHFLFNTLHAVSALVERDPEGVRRMVARLSGLLRHVLEGSPAQEVPLREELAFLRGYLDIQQVRFQGSLEVVEEVQPDALDALVPNLLLQPLVENAVEHGASRIEDGMGRIDIGARIDGADLVLTVRDNGPGLDEPPARNASGVGLANTRERLAALYGDAAALRLDVNGGGGLTVTVVLPFHTGADLKARSLDDA